MIRRPPNTTRTDTVLPYTTLVRSEENKMWLVTASGLDKDALHIYFGLALFLAARLIWRRAGGWLIAWGAVLAMACGGEWLDMTSELRNAAIQPDAAHWHEIWHTLFWPTDLLAIGRASCRERVCQYV